MKKSAVRAAAKQEALQVSLIPAEVRYQAQKELLFGALERQYEYGKWLLASLLTVHAGSLLAISQAGAATARLYQACGPLLIYGVATTLVAGGLAWINFSVVANVYAGFLSDIRNGREPILIGGRKWLAKLTFWITPLVAIGALILFLVAAVRAASVI
ncbi:hypothetical protein [Mesorhizobium sp. BR1-1-4]|uniref:hypothetical protein n=1 Tax=Mesorhizobium sp. BR1-1-4 TaxID=2876650 RepID=UPI001CCE53C1|nr:hypothetical protein [Mesorhizobium sp. BR1-1-4]MBZ9926769.1 hypothetical protein [Mesorhizobium sp. BR1-1-4]